MIDPNGPFGGPNLLSYEVEAFRALERGEATPHQQQVALSALLKKLCRVYDVHYLPDDERGTNFLLGRAFPGQRVMRAIRMQPAELRKLEETEKRNA